VTGFERKITIERKLEEKKVRWGEKKEKYKKKTHDQSRVHI